jgi:hypothetical protein
MRCSIGTTKPLSVIIIYPEQILPGNLNTMEIKKITNYIQLRISLRDMTFI